VIGKVIRGTNVARLLHYLYGPGRANEHTDPHLVAGFGDPAELEPARRPTGSRDLRRLAGLLTQPLAALDGSNYAKPVWHCSLRTAPGDRLLSDAEWAEVAAQVMYQAGLAPAGDDLAVRWVAVRHAPDHIHLVATLARQDGHRPKLWNDFFQVRRACQEAERRFGLRATAPADRTAARRPTRAETEQAARRQWPEPPRETLRREVCTAAAGARTEQEFFTRLVQADVLVRRRHSSTRSDEVTGYAVSLPGHTAKDGEPIWYGGGKLAADLTLPKLRARWAGPQSTDPLAGAADLPHSAVRGILRTTVSEVARQAVGEADFFVRLRASGLLVRERYSELRPGQVTGYSVALPGCTGPDGTLRWCGGGRLHETLTLPRLRNAWARANRTTEHDETPGFTAPERDEIYRHAARQAAEATEHLRCCTASDPDDGADAAWATADAFHSAARTLRSPLLRCAAAGFDRAARAPYGRAPYGTRQGDQLRAAARLLAMIGANSSSGAGQVSVLIANLIALVDAVAGLREAQMRAAQATAARTTAQQMHADWTQACRRAARPGYGHARPPGPRTPSASAHAQADFPVPIDEALRAAARDSTDLRSRPHPPQHPRVPGQPADFVTRWTRRWRLPTPLCRSTPPASTRPSPCSAIRPAPARARPQP
jgi:hypothetical protein